MPQTPVGYDPQAPQSAYPQLPPAPVINPNALGPLGPQGIGVTAPTAQAPTVPPIPNPFGGPGGWNAGPMPGSTAALGGTLVWNPGVQAPLAPIPAGTGNPPTTQPTWPGGGLPPGVPAATPAPPPFWDTAQPWQASGPGMPVMGGGGAPAWNSREALRGQRWAGAPTPMGYLASQGIAPPAKPAPPAEWTPASAQAYRQAMTDAWAPFLSAAREQMPNYRQQLMDYLAGRRPGGRPDTPVPASLDANQRWAAGW